MSEENFTLHISAGSHITSLERRLADAEVGIDQIDVVFEENVTHNPPSGAAVWMNYVAVFLLWPALFLYLRGLNFADNQGWTDKSVVDRLEKAGAEVVEVDRNVHRLITTGRKYWAVTHWGLFLASFFGINQWVEFATPIAEGIFVSVNRIFSGSSQRLLAILVIWSVALVWFFIMGILTLGFFIAGTMEARNHEIVNNIEDYVDSNPEATAGYLIVGKAHQSHIEELVSNSEKIQLTE